MDYVLSQASEGTFQNITILVPPKSTFNLQPKIGLLRRTKDLRVLGKKPTRILIQLQANNIKGFQVIFRL